MKRVRHRVAKKTSSTSSTRGRPQQRYPCDKNPGDILFSKTFGMTAIALRVYEKDGWRVMIEAVCVHQEDRGDRSFWMSVVPGKNFTMSASDSIGLSFVKIG